MTEDPILTEDKNTSELPSRKETWTRLLYTLLFAIIYGVAEVVFVTVVIVQFGFKLITGETNKLLFDFSKRLNKYVFQILQYMTFVADEKPFPFSDWPVA